MEVILLYTVDICLFILRYCDHSVFCLFFSWRGVTVGFGKKIVLSKETTWGPLRSRQPCTSVCCFDAVMVVSCSFSFPLIKPVSALGIAFNDCRASTWVWLEVVLWHMAYRHMIWWSIVPCWSTVRSRALKWICYFDSWTFSGVHCMIPWLKSSDEHLPVH